jgi:nucleotide-binding universal stress UspA family protein
MFKQIIVPTDGSSHARRAVDLAADLASKYNAEILILHVLLRNISAFDLKELCIKLESPQSLIAELDGLETTVYDSADLACSPIFAIVPDIILANIGDLVLEDAKKIAAAKGVTEVATASAAGDPAACILETAEQDEADLIVMGSRGLGKLADLLMGGVSHKVSHLSKCTCVTVK